MQITVEAFQQAVRCPPWVARVWAPEIQASTIRWGIDTPERVAGFLAQMAHESANFSQFEENLNYSAEALVSMFGRHRITEAQAREYGRTAGHPANKEQIANTLYGGTWGLQNLGNTDLGDGWKYRGRGPKQITGRTNYRDFGLITGLDVLGNPDLLLQPKTGALSAGWFWRTRGCNQLQDQGDFEAVTRAINGGLIGLGARRELWENAKKVLGVL